MLTLWASFTHYFNLIESGFSLDRLFSGEMTTVFLVLAFAVLLLLELYAPKIERPRDRLARSCQANLGLFAFNSLAVSVLSITSLLVVIESYSKEGLLSFISSPLLKTGLSFLLLDLFLYLWHRACHSFDGLWLFHKVHHNDPYLNVSTAFRIHLAEVVITNILKGIYIILLGIDKKIVVIYEIVYTLFVMFHHANIAFRGEKWLGQLVITPYLHRVHHAKERRDHDSNYGAVFSIWDRLLRTMKRIEPEAIGIKGDSPQTFWGLVKFGFQTPPPAAETPMASPAHSPAFTFGAMANLHAMISEAAYYKAEKRAFSPGYELYDWLEAKREIFRQVYGENCVNC